MTQETTPEDRHRTRLRAVSRARVRLAQRYPKLFAALVAEELAKEANNGN